MAVVNPSRFLPSDGHEGKVFDPVGYENALKESGYTAESAQKWWEENPSGEGYTHHSSIELNDNTGQITIKAPKWFLESETYQQYFDDDVLTGLGRLYAQNKDAKLEMADGTEKTVKEIIESWNNDLPKLVKAQETLLKMKEGIGEKFGEEAANNWTLGTYQLAGTSAYSGRDDDYLVIPNSILNSANWSFLKDMAGLDKETGYITKKDFGEGYYHVDALRDLPSESSTSISRLKKDVSNALQNFQGSDMNEYAKLIAFNNFLNGQAAEGADNSAKGDFLNKTTVDAAAFCEAFARATAATATSLVNKLGSYALAPFSVVDWIGGKTNSYQSKFIIDEVVGVTGDLIGDNLTPGADSVAEFLENEKNRRGDLYALTDSTAGLIYNLTYVGTYATESVLQSIAMTRLLINGVTLGITGTSIARGIPKVTESIQRMGMLGAKTTAADGSKVPLWTTRAAEAIKANSAMVSGGVSQRVADLLTGMGGYSTWDKINLIGSLNPAELINGAYIYNQYVGKVGEDLAIIGGAGKAGAEGYERAYADLLKRNASLWMSQGRWGDLTTTAEKIAYLRYLQPRFEAIYNTGNALLQTAAKVVTTLNAYTKYMPTVYYASQVIIGTALSESDTIRRLMQGSNSNEQRDLLWGMIARNALGWTIGLVVGKIVGKVFNGDFDQAVEGANLKATEKIAKGVVAIRNRTDQFHMLVNGGKDWVDNISNPVKKSVVRFNQSLAKSQEYIAGAADLVRNEGGTEIAARAATKAAIDQMKANQNAIDLMQHPEWQVASWHTDAYPAYNNASNVFTGINNDLSKMLTELGLNVGVKPTAVIGGVATNADLPQDVVNYMARALQRASYLRDDFDVSNMIVQFGQITAPFQSQYKITDPALIKEREIAKSVMAEFEDKYPKEVSDYIKDKWVPAAQNTAFQHNQVIIGTGYYLKSQEEGWRKSGMWGPNNELWFPLQRVTDAQKDFEEAARNPMKVIKSGAIKRRSTDLKHLAPGSDKMTDFVHPMATWKMHEFQTAVDLSVRNWVHVNLTNPFIKHVTKLDGAQVGAAVTYDDLKPHYEKAVIQSLNATKQVLDESGLVNDMVDKQKMETRLKNAKKAVADAKKTWENIPKVKVDITDAARSRTIDTLPENVINDYLDKLEIPFEGEKVDTRKWLNKQVPSFDILDWSLLGREHTHGLYPGGLYDWHSGYDVLEPQARAYIMDLDDLIKLVGYTNLDGSDGGREIIINETNTQGGNAVLPLHIRNTQGETDIWLKNRWGHSGDGLSEWKDYLKSLKEAGITKVPVAVEASGWGELIGAVRNSGLADKGLNNIVEEIDKAIATGNDPDFKVRDIAAALMSPGMTRSRLRAKIRHGIGFPDGNGGSTISDAKIDELFEESELYNWAEDEDLSNAIGEIIPKTISEKLGFLPMDITAEIGEAMIEHGQIPLYHNQDDDYGSLEANNKEAVPTTREGQLYGNRGAGDALWLAPNANYTDPYGRNKLIGSIPVKYFMSDKEKWDILSKYKERGLALTGKIKNNIKKKRDAFDPNKPVKKHTFAASAKGEIAALRGGFFPVPELPGNYWVDLGGNLYSHLYTTSPDSDHQDKMVLVPDNRKFPVTDVWYEVNYGDDFLTAKEAKELEEARKYLDLESDEASIRSYRALAEMTGKPVIDISRDGFASGTAFFYYKGVNPEFDEKLGQQLASQALFRGQNVYMAGDEIAKAMEEYDGMSLYDMIDYATNGEGVSGVLDDALWKFADGEISSGELTESFYGFADGIAADGYPGIANVMKVTWDNNTIKDLRDMKFNYWHPSTGYETITDEDAVAFLKDFGKAVGTEEDLQPSFYDLIAPTIGNVPVYTDQDLADMRLRDLERKRKILKKELKKRCD